MFNIIINTVNASSNKTNASFDTLDYEALFYPESGYYIDRGSVSGTMGVENIVDYIVPEGTRLKLLIEEIVGDITITVTGKRIPQVGYIYPYIDNANGYTNLLGSLRVL